MTKTEEKIKAQDILMQKISEVGYSQEYEDFVNEVGDREQAEEIMFNQMNRIARCSDLTRHGFRD